MDSFALHQYGKRKGAKNAKGAKGEELKGKLATHVRTCKRSSSKGKLASRWRRCMYGVLGSRGTANLIAHELRALVESAEVAKLADAPDLGSGGAILRGSSPLLGIILLR